MNQSIKLAIALILAFTIGAACHWVTIPVPAPTALEGGLLLLSMTAGYVLMDKVLTRNQTTSNE